MARCGRKYDGWVCSLDEGHGGKHSAEGYHEWADAPIRHEGFSMTSMTVGSCGGIIREGNSAWHCTLSSGHAGEHVARNTRGDFVIHHPPRVKCPFYCRTQGGKQFYTCSLENGHVGDHVTHLINGDSLGAWQQEVPPDTDKPPIGKNGSHCQARGGSLNLICTRDKDHAGDHAAHLSSGEFLEAWPQEKLPEETRCQLVCPKEKAPNQIKGFNCSLPKGHAGDHAAHQGHDLSLDPVVRWSSDKPPATTQLPREVLPDVPRSNDGCCTPQHCFTCGEGCGGKVGNMHEDMAKIFEEARKLSDVEEVQPTERGRNMFRFLFKSAFVLAALASFTSHTPLWEPAKAKGFQLAGSAVRWWTKGPTDDFGFLAKELLAQLQDPDGWHLEGEETIVREPLMVTSLKAFMPDIYHRGIDLQGQLTQKEHESVCESAKRVYKAKKEEAQERLAREIAADAAKKPTVAVRR